MNITRPNSLDAIDKIAPFISVPNSEMKQLFLADLAVLMVQNPMALLFLTWFDDIEEDIRAFLIAKDPGPHYPYVKVTQLWSHPDNPRSWLEPFFGQLVLWAIAHDKKYMLAETQRDLGAVLQRFKFEPYAQIVKFDLVDSGYYYQLTQHPEEVING